MRICVSDECVQCVQERMNVRVQACARPGVRHNWFHMWRKEKEKKHKREHTGLINCRLWLEKIMLSVETSNCDHNGSSQKQVKIHMN